MKYLIIYALNAFDTALAEPWVFAVIKLVLFPLMLWWMWKQHHDDTAWFALGAFAAVTVLNISTVFGG